MAAVRFLGILAAGNLFLASPVARGGSYTWQVLSGDWSVASNWGGTLPTGSDTADIFNGGTATVTTMAPTCGTLSLGSSAGSGTVQMTGGGLSAASCESVGDSGTGTFVQSGGTNSVGSLGYLYLGYNLGGSGTYSLSGSGQVSASYEYVGANGSGTFTQSGGTNRCDDDFVLGCNAGASGAYNLSGSGQLLLNDDIVGYGGTGTFTQSGGTNSLSDVLSLGLLFGSSGTYSLSGSGLVSAYAEYVGFSGTGAFTQSGGTNSASNGLYLSGNVGASGTYSLSGGLLSASDIYLGWSGAGTFNHSGGTAIGNQLFVGYNNNATYNLSGSGQLSVANEYVGYYGPGVFTQSGGTNTTGALALGSSATYNLNGGLLQLSALTGGTGATAFNFSGGTLRAGATFSTSVPITVGASGGGATFDTAGSQLTLSGSLSGPGSLTLDDSLGTGRLILIGSNSYRGGTIVEAGTLEVTNSDALPDGGSLTVGSEATLVFDRAVAAPPATGASAAVPEPSTLALLAVGVIGLAVCAWRRRQFV